MPVIDTSPHIEYRIHGCAGPKILLIMGLGMRGVVWSPQTDVLASDHHLITFDNRGIGGSEMAPGGWTMADMADDARRVLDAAGWTSAHVVGVSMGGMIAQELALRAPTRLRSLTLIATHAGGPTGWVPPFSGVVSFLGVNLLPADQRFRALAHLLYPEDFLRLVDRDELAARMGEQVGSRASAATRNKQIKAVMQHDTRARLAQIKTPTMVVISEQDKLVNPRRQYALADAIPHAERLVFDRAGHGVIFQCARVLNGQIARHIAAHEPALSADIEGQERAEGARPDP